MQPCKWVRCPGYREVTRSCAASENWMMWNRGVHHRSNVSWWHPQPAVKEMTQHNAISCQGMLCTADLVYTNDHIIWWLKLAESHRSLRVCLLVFLCVRPDTVTHTVAFQWKQTSAKNVTEGSPHSGNLISDRALGYFSICYNTAPKKDNQSH